jgi:hypothetical protein
VPPRRLDGVKIDQGVVVQDRRMFARDEAHPAHVRGERVYLIHTTHSDESVVTSSEVEDLELISVRLCELRKLEVNSAHPVSTLLQVRNEVVADEASRPGHQYALRPTLLDRFPRQPLNRLPSPRT